MQNIYAALLLHKAGKEINQENLTKVIAAVGEHVDESKVKSLVASLKGVDIENELKNASVVASSVPASGTHAEKKEEAPKEEKKAAAAEGLSALFG